MRELSLNFNRIDEKLRYLDFFRSIVDADAGGPNMNDDAGACAEFSGDNASSYQGSDNDIDEDDKVEETRRNPKRSR